MDDNLVCASCYKKVNTDYVYCFMCNRKKNSLKQCSNIKKNGHQCLFKTVNEFCFYHKKKVEA